MSGAAFVGFLAVAALIAVFGCSVCYFCGAVFRGFRPIRYSVSGDGYHRVNRFLALAILVASFVMLLSLLPVAGALAAHAFRGG